MKGISRGAACAGLWLAALPMATLAQTPAPAPLATPDLKVWTSGVVNAMHRDAAGGLVVAGGFSEINGVARRNLARLLPDGSVDMAFAPNPDGAVGALVADEDGTLYVTGSFSSIGGQAHARLARLSGAGAVDATWSPVLDAGAQALALGDDELYLGGFFNSVNGQARPRLARVSLAGSGPLDTTWTPTANTTVSTLAYDASDDSLFLGGDFVTVNGDIRARIAKIDGGGSGALRAWDAPANQRVEHMELDGAGSLYVSGAFDVIGANGAARKRVARLSTATGDADAFVLAFLDGTNGAVQGMDLQGGALFLTGAFTEVNGLPRDFAAKVSTLDASVDLAFAPVLDQPTFNVFAPGDGNVYFSGSATRYVNGDLRIGAVRVDATTGATGSPVDVVIPGTVYAMQALPGGGQVIGGDFYRIDGSPRENLAKLRTDGSLDPDWTASADAMVRELAVDAPNGMLYAAGTFDRAGGQPRNAVAKFALAGTGALQAWDAQVPGRAALQPVQALAVDAAGDVIVGGFFAEIGGQVRANLARLDGDDATLDTAWGTGANASVTALALGPDGDIYASGFFTAINDGNRDRFAKLDGATGAVELGFLANLVPGERVHDFAFADGALYIAGNFTAIGATPRGRVARIDPASGAVDTTFAASANNDVYEVVPAGSHVFLAGGGFFQVNGAMRLRLARVAAADGALDATWDPQVYDGSLEAAVLDPAGNLVIAGNFRNIGLAPRQGLAAVPPALPVVVLPEHVFGDGFEE